jgi:4-hydroxy-tetrahydrodipicolinate synthase
LLTLGIMACGARGVISVSSNVVPREVQKLTEAFLRGEIDDARKRHLAMVAFHVCMFVETNRGPVKAALRARGLA